MKVAERKIICAFLIILAVILAGLSFGVSKYRKSTRKSTPGWVTVPYVAHACGEIDGVKYTNSVEALQHTLEEGNISAIEADLRLTQDDRVVCAHSWKKIGIEDDTEPTYDEFMNSKVEKLYTPMDLKDLISILAKAHVYLVVDARNGGEGLLKIYQALVDECVDNAPEYLPYVIPQIYKTSQYEQLEEIYSFSDYILTLFRIQPKSIQEYTDLAQACLEDGINVVTMMNKMATQEVVDIYTSRGITVAVHTIDSPERFAQLRQEGVSLVYTNNLYEKVK